MDRCVSCVLQKMRASTFRERLFAVGCRRPLSFLLQWGLRKERRPRHPSSLLRYAGEVFVLDFTSHCIVLTFICVVCIMAHYAVAQIMEMPCNRCHCWAQGCWLMLLASGPSMQHLGYHFRHVCVARSHRGFLFLFCFPTCLSCARREG